MQTICTFTGLRPHKLPQGTDYPALYAKLENEVRASISAGYRIFQSGVVMGIDIVAAELVVRLKKQLPGIRLHCYRPCETQAINWPVPRCERYKAILGPADEVFLLQPHYTSDCMLRRNRARVDKSSKLIAVHDKRTEGGTAYTIRYAQSRKLQIAVINPLECKSTGDERAVPLPAVHG